MGLEIGVRNLGVCGLMGPWRRGFSIIDLKNSGESFELKMHPSVIEGHLSMVLVDLNPALNPVNPKPVCIRLIIHCSTPFYYWSQVKSSQRTHECQPYTALHTNSKSFWHSFFIIPKPTFL